MSDTKKEISQGDPKGEEFVEEIRLLWCEECSEGPGRYDYQASLDDPICAVGAEKECRERARKIIARILSAVRDGLEIPGEVERYDGVTSMMVARNMDEIREEGPFTQYIALSPAGILPGIPGTGAVERQEGAEEEEK